MPFRSVSFLLLSSLTIVNEGSSLAIINKGSLLAIVNEGSSLTIVNEGSLLTIVNETTSFIKTIILKNDCFSKRPFKKKLLGPRNLCFVTKICSLYVLKIYFRVSKIYMSVTPISSPSYLSYLFIIYGPQNLF